MNTRAFGANLIAVSVLGSALIAPVQAIAQDGLGQASHHRQQTKNGWRNAAIGSGALGVLGLATHNSTLAVLGLAGGAYSASRYEHDRRSQSHIDRARAAYFSRDHYYEHGHRYVRKTVWRDGHRYYKFVRG